MEVCNYAMNAVFHQRKMFFNDDKYLFRIDIAIFMRNDVPATKHSTPINLRIKREQFLRCLVVNPFGSFTNNLNQHASCIKFLYSGRRTKKIVCRSNHLITLYDCLGLFNHPFQRLDNSLFRRI